ncbi:hypothetical protein HNY73_007208 [Argiope bruennichi]|uniref:DUF5641 domain-containing protein n=1 Tax=Argiope bruennichi TaxID=94029 RepID=A0A8T0FIS6_ARGBR|nr:hypothetical protein HNY73_007208 [Argiope bruennichi]
MQIDSVQKFCAKEGIVWELHTSSISSLHGYGRQIWSYETDLVEADIQPLTPGHFLVGAPLLSIPEPSDSLTNISLSSRWSLIQSLRSKFWKRWSQEYLNSLQSRAKWKLPELNIKPGQLVLLKDNSKSPMEWNLARIERTYPGTDGLVRVADIRTPKGIFRRSINRLCPLPFEEGVGQLSNGGRDVPS